MAKRNKFTKGTHVQIADSAYGAVTEGLQGTVEHYFNGTDGERYVRVLHDNFKVLPVLAYVESELVAVK